MKKGFSWEAFDKAPIVSIFRNLQSEALMQVASCLEEAGISTMEITLNSLNARKDISRLEKEFGNTLNIGAGTVCDLFGMHEALEAGAQFIVTPIADKDVINYCVSQGIPVFPGAFTPTEIYEVWQMGATMVKVFPANAMGPGYIKDILGPLNKIQLMPTGGINENNIKDYFNAGAKAVGMGSGLVPIHYIEKKDWSGLKEHLKTFIGIVPSN